MSVMAESLRTEVANRNHLRISLVRVHLGLALIAKL